MILFSWKLEQLFNQPTFTLQQLFIFHASSKLQLFQALGDEQRDKVLVDQMSGSELMVLVEYVVEEELL